MAQHNIWSKSMRSQLSWHYGKMHCNSTWAATSYPIHSRFVGHVSIDSSQLPNVQYSLLCANVRKLQNNPKRMRSFAPFDVFKMNMLQVEMKHMMSTQSKINIFWPKYDTHYTITLYYNSNIKNACGALINFPSQPVEGDILERVLSLFQTVNDMPIVNQIIGKQWTLPNIPFCIILSHSSGVEGKLMKSSIEYRILFCWSELSSFYSFPFILFVTVVVGVLYILPWIDWKRFNWSGSENAHCICQPSSQPGVSE